MGPTNLCPKIFCVKKLLGKKNFWIQKKISVPKKIWVPKILSPKNFGSKKMWVQKNLGPKKFWVKFFSRYLRLSFYLRLSDNLKSPLVPSKVAESSLALHLELFWVGLDGKHLVIMLSQFNWNFNSLLELSLAIIIQRRLWMLENYHR